MTERTGTLRALIRVSPAELHKVAAMMEEFATGLGGATAARSSAAPPADGAAAVSAALVALLSAADRAVADTADAYRDTAARVRRAAAAYESADGFRSW
ncbi:MAG TPA: type VII secretion target [Micromonosporaceae bacterium]|nr:type VII secretion target [Micromonosporaceae bacterium]